MPANASHDFGHPWQISKVSLNQRSLEIAEIIAVTRYGAQIDPFTGPRRQQVEKVRTYVERHWLTDEARPRYGFNTGIGVLKNVRISHEDIEKFQRLYVKAHSVGVGSALDVEIVRGAMLLQAQALARGHSGVRAVVIDKLIEMLNKGIHPVVPEQGSLGASGDLAPLTHIAAVLVGEDDAEIWVGTVRRKLSSVKDKTGNLRFQTHGQTVEFEPLVLGGKEAVSLTNATAVMLSFGVHLVYDGFWLLKNADISAALSLEAMMCEQDAFAEKLHDLRNQTGQIRTAANIRALVKGTGRMHPEARLAFLKARQFDPKASFYKSESFNDISSKSGKSREHSIGIERLQDAYSLRCVPQVHGACKDSFAFVRDVIDRELMAVTDNPVIFPDGHGGFESKSGGNFHGEPLALAFDFLAIALSEIGSIAERRLYRLLNPSMNFGLPRNLSGGEVGLNTGYMMVQYTAAQLVSENKILAHPASVDTIPTSDNQEDHVSMGLTAARKAQRILVNVQNVIAMEYLCAVQGLQLSARSEGTDFERFPLGEGTRTAFEFLTCVEGDGRRPFAVMGEDEYLKSRLDAARALVADGAVVKAVEEKIELLV